MVITLSTFCAIGLNHNLHPSYAWKFSMPCVLLLMLLSSCIMTKLSTDDEVIDEVVARKQMNGFQ